MKLELEDIAKNFQRGLIKSSNLGISRVMPSQGSTQGATMVGAEWQNFQNLDL